MPTLPELPPFRARSCALGVTLALHLALLMLWHAQQRARAPAPGPEPTVFVRWIKPLPPARRAASKVAPAAAPPAPPAPARAPVSARASARPTPSEAAARTELPAAAEPISAAPSSAAPSSAAPSRATPSRAAPSRAAPFSFDPGVAAPAARSAADILQQGRRDVGKIDRDLRAASPNKNQWAADTALSRFNEKMDAATRAPAWYEPAKIEPVLDQGGSGRHIYKIKTAFGTYCATYESEQSRDGVDRTNGHRGPTITNCPRELPMH
jgi:hypothetical protein